MALSVLTIFLLILSLVWASSESKENAHKMRNFKALASNYPFNNVSLPWEDRVNDLVNRLTLEEIQDQMAHAGGGSKPAKAIDRLGIGRYQWSTECLRGDVSQNATAFPQSLGLAAAFRLLENNSGHFSVVPVDLYSQLKLTGHYRKCNTMDINPDLIFRMAQATAVEVRGKHNDFVKQGIYDRHTGASCFSPVINIMRDPRWGRNQETYGEDPYLSGVYAANFIQGLQGNDTRYVRASGGCKHFDVHGGPENIPVSRFKFNAQVSERDWRSTFLPAFRKCVEAGTYNLMCSYNSVNGIPACANHKLLTDILRMEWGFKGYVISDGGALHVIVTGHQYFNNSVDTAAACANAGCSLELGGGSDPIFMSILDAVKQNKTTEDKVRELVKPMFYTRMRLGEFDPPEMNPYSNLSNADVLTPEHKALAVEAAMKSFVLLKNVNGTLPLNKTGTIGVVGPMANDPLQLFGDYTPNPPRNVSTPLLGLSALASRTQYASGCNDTPCSTYSSSAVLKAISGTDINFVVLGTGQAIEREGNDRPDTELPGQQKTLLQDVINNTPPHVPIILLLFNAGPVNISIADQDPRVSAIMECFFPATFTGDALRHVLLNDVKGAVPAGRLPFTWPMWASQIPPMTNYSMEGRTYRYYEGEPLYPFGYGLSYTKFEYIALGLPESIRAGDTAKGFFIINNNGSYSADEVAQIYVSWRNKTTPSPALQLVWFDRITQVETGVELIQVDFEIDPKSLALWHPDGWYIEQGTLDVYVGGQQPNQKRNASSNVIHTSLDIIGTKYLGKY